MSNLGETKPINKLIISMDGDDYVFEGGGGSITPGVPIPEDTVNSAAIIDGAVEMEDLNQSVKDAMVTENDRVTQEELDGFEV